MPIKNFHEKLSGQAGLPGTGCRHNVNGIDSASYSTPFSSEMIEMDLKSNKPFAALEPGEYRDFTGYIFHRNGLVEGYAEDASFDLVDSSDDITMNWLDGTWVSGQCASACWQGGTWLNGTFSEGNWYGGDWKDGTFYRGAWVDGTWGGGVFEGSQWRNGVWVNGIFRESAWLNGRWLEGYWENGVWIDEQGVCRNIDHSRWRRIRLEKHFY